jgi:hypothetical protein
VYEKYVEDMLAPSGKDRLNTLLQRQDISVTLEVKYDKYVEDMLAPSDKDCLNTLLQRQDISVTLEVKFEQYLEDMLTLCGKDRSLLQKQHISAISALH